MSQTFDRAPPRFSRRQVTKRKFNILGSPSVLQSVRTYKNNRIDTENNKIHTQVNRNRNKRQTLGSQKLTAQRSRTTRKRSNTNDSPSDQHAQSQEHNENEDGREPVTDDADKDVEQGESTPQRKQMLGLADDSQTPGDVSVTFLASTPKPGQPQLSRRRPMSPVRETSEMLLGTCKATRTEEQGSKESKENNVTMKLQVKQTGVLSPKKQLSRKQSPRKLSPQKKSPQKRVAGASIDEMIASSNKSRLENKRKNNEIHIKLSENDVSNKTDRNRSTVALKPDNDFHRESGSAKRQKVKDITVTSRDSNIEDEVDRTVVDKSVIEIEGMESRLRNKNKRSRNVQTPREGTDDLPNRLKKGDIVSRTRLEKNMTSVDGDVTVRNTSARPSLSSHRRKSAVNTKLQALSKHKNSPDTILPDQTLIVWETEGQERTRTDLIDLDVVLNTVTETLASRMDVYDTDEEQSAVHLLEKYLTKDITHLIHGVQTVAELQSKIKKCGQSIKQKQKSLMSLQKERVELEEKCRPAKKINEKNETTATINQFLTDLGKVIDMC